MTEHSRNKIKRAPRFRFQLFALLAVFIAVMLLLLWIFQIGLLRPMYESIKMREMKTVTRLITESVESEKNAPLTDRLAKKTNICITVYRIVGQNASVYRTSHIRSSCYIHNVASEPMLNRLYAGALREPYYTERLSGGFFKPSEESSDAPESVISAALTEETGGARYLIVLNAEIEPVGTTEDTLRVQLGVISAVLLIVAAVTAIVVSGKMSRTLTQMSEEARKLALGNYDVHFEGGNTRETAELSEALNYAAGELSELDSMQKELLANISHDLRTPLTMISGYSEVMRDIPGEMTPENMQIVIDETHRLSALVNDLLDLSKLKDGANSLNCTVISLTDTVRQTLDRYSKLRTHDGYNIEFLSDGEVFIYADTSKILQVIYNLVNNAISYTGEDKRVTIRQICRDGVCRIEVSDTGEGIPADQLPLIWDRYYKLKNYHKRPLSGSGLGLSIVKNILLLHGAKFGVQSEVGHGSTFWFELPQVQLPRD